MKSSDFKYILALFFTILIIRVTSQPTYNAPPDNYGGRAAIRELIKNEMYYPPEAIEKKMEGKVKLKFWVMPDGTAQNNEIIEGVHPLLNTEAIRLFNLILWEPAVKKGEKVAAVHHIEFDFKIKRYKKYVKQRSYNQSYEEYAGEEPAGIYALTSLSSMPTPVFKNPEQKYSDFISKNLKYPEAAVKQNITGTVEVFFVVEPTGRPTNIKVLRGIGAGCNEEAIRLVALLRWQPGTKDGKNVRSEMTLNITFNLPGTENIRYIPTNNQNQF